MLRPFIGVIVVWLTERALGPELSLWLGAAVGLSIAGYVWRIGRAKVMDLAAPFLVATLALGRSTLGEGVADWGGPFIFGGLAAVALISVLIGRSFTEADGRERSPAAVHGTRAFCTVHRQMSLGWAAGLAGLAGWFPLAAGFGWSDSVLAALVPVVVLAAGHRLSERFAVGRLAPTGSADDG